MKVIKGSDLIGFCQIMDELRFMHARFATEDALKRGAKSAELKRLLKLWLDLTEPQRPRKDQG